MIALAMEKREAMIDDTMIQLINAQPKVPNPATDFLDEPQILFLGTVSMRPSMFRNSSAIYIFSQDGALLMDCSEGTYQQMFDHFGTKVNVDQVILKTKVVFITHMHGDHQLGILKIMYERDKLMRKKPSNQRTKLFIALPTLMRNWMEVF